LIVHRDALVERLGIGDYRARVPFNSWYNSISATRIPHGVQVMSITVEAVYENGVLKPAAPLPFKESEKVRVTVEPELTWVQRTAGMMRFAGTADDE
jgi:predicted DNA-binding antitoxin AbrB/MazE fold protein